MSLDRIGYGMSWWDLICVLRWLPADSALSRLKNPLTWWRTVEVEIAAGQLDALRGGNWQRSGGQGTRPDPVLPAWPTPEVLPASNAKPKMTPTQIRDELARRRELRQAQVG